MAKIKTFHAAYKFVLKVNVCTLFSDKVEGVHSLWDAVDLPENSGGKTKWGAKVEAVWAWKNELPSKYPDEIFYGKLPGGHAVLMTLAYLRDTHYPANWKPVDQLTPLAQQVYELVRVNSGGKTGEIRKQAIQQYACTKSRFETAFKQLQVTLNIARVIQPGSTNDAWVPFREMYVDLLESPRGGED